MRDPARIEQTAGDASVRLEPHGFVATMTEPVEDESLTNLAKLRVQAASETSWFASQPALAPLLPKGLLTCNALVDKVNVMYLRFLLDRWAPQTLFRSEEHTSELQSLAYLVCRLLLEKKKQKKKKKKYTESEESQN